MKRLIISLLLVAVVGCEKSEQAEKTSSNEPNQQANKLFVEAVQLIKSAEFKSDEDAIKDYEQALSNIQRIIDDYSKSDLAVKLISGKAVLNDKTVSDIKVHVTQLKRQIEHEERVTEAAFLKLRPRIARDDDGNLVSLNYFGEPIGDADLENINKLTWLTVLDISRTKITDAGLKHLRGLTKIETLYLHDTELTDTGLEHLKGLKKLKTLSLYDTQITDAGLDHLKGLTNLTFLSLGYTQITDTGAADLQKALPDCEISH